MLLALHFQSNDIRDMDVLAGNLSSVEYFIWGMKEPNYVINIMSTGGDLVIIGCKETHRKWIDGKELH